MSPTRHGSRSTTPPVASARVHLAAFPFVVRGCRRYNGGAPAGVVGWRMPVKKSELSGSIWAACDHLRGGMDASQD